MKQMYYWIIEIVVVFGIVFISGCTERYIFAKSPTETNIYNPPANIIVTPVTFTDEGLCYNKEYNSTRLSLSDVALTADSYTKLKTNIKESPDALWGISNLVCLEFLYLGGIGQISNISALSGLTNLKSLNLLETRVTDISPLSNLKNLEMLYLTKTPISDVSHLQDLTNLKLLSLAETEVSSSDCNSLKQYLTKTEILCADFNYFS